ADRLELPGQRLVAERPARLGAHAGGEACLVAGAALERRRGAEAEAALERLDRARHSFAAAGLDQAEVLAGRLDVDILVEPDLDRLGGRHVLRAVERARGLEQRRLSGELPGERLLHARR